MNLLCVFPWKPNFQRSNFEGHRRLAGWLGDLKAASMWQGSREVNVPPGRYHAIKYKSWGFPKRPPR
jgi:hypothetical protein